MWTWRICRKNRTASDGEGARLYGGRWNHRGVRVVYTSATLSLAALERFVNADPVTEPDDLVALSAEVPDRLHVEAIELARLPGNWRAYPPPDALQDLGDEWIRSGRSPVLAVPSAVIPTERNYLLNPLHSDFRHVRFADPDPFRFDPRMWKSSKTRR